MNTITFKIYVTVKNLPESWDLVAASNHFLQSPYLQVLENAAPINMKCFYIGIFENNILIGVALTQYLNLNDLESFGDRESCFKTYVRNLIFRKFASHVLFLGNNMITGQNAFTFSKEVHFKEVSNLLMNCSKELIAYFKAKGTKIHMVSFKDFYKESAYNLSKYAFKSLYEFDTQPNMVFNLDLNWNTKEDYVNAFTKKYRNDYTRAHKKISGVVMKELSVNEVVYWEERIYDLYHHVAKNALFNTFYLAKNHFSVFKKQCGSKFRIYGYFLENELIGFHSLLLNEDILETYFLGYDKNKQKEKMLYMNMLYNITEFGIQHGFKRIIFGRTALEIKSAIGAKPVKMSGFIYHSNYFINIFMGSIFKNLEPKTVWTPRNPFK